MVLFVVARRTINKFALLFLRLIRHAIAHKLAAARWKVLTTDSVYVCSCYYALPNSRLRSRVIVLW